LGHALLHTPSVSLQATMHDPSLHAWSGAHVGQSALQMSSVSLQAMTQTPALQV
jgi:hypothetical protein